MPLGLAVWNLSLRLSDIHSTYTSTGFQKLLFVIAVKIDLKYHPCIRAAFSERGKRGGSSFSLTLGGSHCIVF